MPMADPTAIVGRRIGAWAVDLIIYLIFAFILASTIGGATSHSYEFGNKEAASQFCTAYKETHSNAICFTSGSGEKFTSYTVEDGWRSVAFWSIHLVLYAVIQGSMGASIGKLAVGLRVVDAEGKQAGMGKSFVRTIFWIVDAITCGIPLLGGILMTSSSGHRRVGDMVAGTYVVPKEQVGRPPTQIGYPSTGYGNTGFGGTGYPGGYAGGGYSLPSPPVGGGWGAPMGGAAGGPVPPATPGAASGDGPQWDQARNTYIQYDRDKSAWVQWDAATNAWVPISQ